MGFLTLLLVGFSAVPAEATTLRFTNLTNGSILPSNWRDIASSSDGTKLSAIDSNYGGYIYTSIDSGATWTPRLHDVGHQWYAIATSADGNVIIAVQIAGSTFTSFDGGGTWSESPPTRYHAWVSIACNSDCSKVVGVTYGDHIFTSSNFGATWVSGGLVDSFEQVASSYTGEKLIASVQNGYLYTSSNSGATWTQRTSAGSRDWESVASNGDGSELIAADYGGYIYTSTDSGATWTERTSAGSRAWWQVSSSYSGKQLVAVDVNPGGYVYTSNDFGVTWTQQTRAGSSQWIAARFSGDGSKLYVANMGGDIFVAQFPTHNLNGGGGTGFGVGLTPEKVLENQVTMTPLVGALKIQLSLPPNFTTEGTSFTVTSSPNGSFCTFTAASPTCTISGLSAGVAYTISIVATNSFGPSETLVLSKTYSPLAEVKPGVKVALSLIGFKRLSAKLTSAFKGSLSEYVVSHPTLTKFTCTGFASGKPVTKAIKKLAKDRAKAACSYLKKLVPGVELNLLIKTTYFGDGAKYRKVSIVGYQPAA